MGVSTVLGNAEVSSLGMGGVADPLETRPSPRFTVPYLVALCRSNGRSVFF